MTFFEVNGVARQESAWSINYANRQFENSCTLCASRGIPIKCEHCAINQAHQDALKRISAVKETEKASLFDRVDNRLGIVTKVYICL